MDDWPYPYSDPEVVAPSSQPMLLDQVWGSDEDRLRAAHAEAAEQADADRRAADLEQGGVDAGRNVMDVPLPIATPPGVALTF